MLTQQRNRTHAQRGQVEGVGEVPVGGRSERVGHRRVHDAVAVHAGDRGEAGVEASHGEGLGLGGVAEGGAPGRGLSGGDPPAAVHHPRFVPSHPMAGSEQSGLDGARAELFRGAAWVITPT